MSSGSEPQAPAGRWGSLAFQGMFGLVLLIGFMGARFLFPNVVFEPDTTLELRRVEDYDWNHPVEFGADWLVKLYRDPLDCRSALIVVHGFCRDGGGRVRIVLQEECAICECHGARFSFAGLPVAAAGRTPLDRHAVSIDPVTGRVVIEGSVRIPHSRGPFASPPARVVLSH